MCRSASTWPHAFATEKMRAADISEALLPTLSRQDIRDLFPGPEHFLRRKATWKLFHKEQEVQQAASPNQENGSNGRGLATVQVNPCVSETPRPSNPTPPQPDVQEILDPPRTCSYPTLKIVDQRGEAAEDLGVHFGPDSQQSQARHYRTLQEVLKRPKPNKEAVAQLLDLEFDACRAFINSDTLRDQDRPANVMDELRCILDRSNPDFISDLKTSWESFYGKAQFYGVFKKLLGPSTTQDKVTRSIAMMKALPEMFPSPVAPPKNLGHASEAMVHILEPTENPNTYLQRRPVFSPVLIICDSSCMLAIGSTPVITFPKENIDTAVLYLLA
ncbi:hypothetical protein AOLI_G00287750 [Acnodon oligacanthus]